MEPSEAVAIPDLIKEMISMRNKTEAYMTHLMSSLEKEEGWKEYDSMFQLDRSNCEEITEQCHDNQSDVDSIPLSEIDWELLSIPLEIYAADCKDHFFPLLLSRLGYEHRTILQVLETLIQQPTTNALPLFEAFMQTVEQIPVPEMITLEEWNHDTSVDSSSFPWPVFDMAEFEFGLDEHCDINFDNVGVVINVPSMEEAMIPRLETFFGSILFRPMVPNIQQVIVPINRSTGQTKQCVFIEFQDFYRGQQVMAMVNGLEWHPHGLKLQAKMFRAYKGDSELDTASSFASLVPIADAETSNDSSFEQSEENPDNSMDSVSDTLHLRMNVQVLKNRINFYKTEHQQLLNQSYQLELEKAELQQELVTARQQQSEHQALTSRIMTMQSIICQNRQCQQEMQERLAITEQRFMHLKQRLQQVLGHAIDHLELTELTTLEDTLEDSLLRIRRVKAKRMAEQQAQLHQKVEAQAELRLCVVCLTQEKSILCFPCRHLCLCTTCAEHAEMEKCPVCRETIDEKISVFA